MRPDITVELGDGRLLLLDPKYQVGHEGVLNGIDEMHRYRDAIVTESGERAVAAGFLLCPAAPGDRRYLDAGYQTRWGLGVRVRVLGAVERGAVGTVAGVVG